MNSCHVRNALTILLLHATTAFDFSSFGKKPTPKKKTFQESFETYKNKINLPEDAGAFARGTQDSRSSLRRHC